MKKILVFLAIFFHCVTGLYAQAPVISKPLKNSSVGTMICFEIQPESAEGMDAAITTQVPTANYGNHEDFETVTWTCQNVLCLSRSLIDFGLAWIPTTAIIDSAFIFLYANVNAPNGISGQPTYGISNAGYIRRITQSWSEMSVTWNTQPSVTTQDQVIIPQSMTTVDNYVLDVKSLLQTYVQNPATSFGFMISEQDEINYYNSLIFASSDHLNSTLHPKIKICYSLLTRVDENEPSPISINPNPFHDTFTLQNDLNNIKQVDIFSALGEKIKTIIVAGNTTIIGIDFSRFTNGVYFVKILSGEESYIKKIIKN